MRSRIKCSAGSCSELTPLSRLAVLMDSRTSLPEKSAVARSCCSIPGIYPSCSMAASFYSSPLIGATTTLACFAHEIPHEIADYSILIRSGFTKKQAMQSQFLTAIGAFVRDSFAVLTAPRGREAALCRCQD